MKQPSPEKNAKDAVEYLLKEANVKVSSIGLQDELVMHPDFPSLAAISDALNEWNVPNMATRISVDKLKLIPLPALVYLPIDGGIFAPIKSVTTDSVVWLDTHKGWQKDSFTDFAQKWDGTTLLIEAKNESGEHEYIKNKAKETLDSLRIPFLIGGIIALVLAVISLKYIDGTSTSYPTSFFAVAIIKISGTIITAILCQSVINKNSRVIDQLCPIGDQTSCKNILNSRSAYLFSWLSWAEIGLFYFSGSLILLLSGSQPQALLLLTCIALPYTIWSIIHQAFVAKEWCILCVLVQVLLWAEFTFEFNVDSNIFTPINLKEFIEILISFSLIPLLWVYLKPHLKKSLSFDSHLRAMSKLKFNGEYIQSMSNNSRTLPPIFDGMKVISFGDSNATNILTVIASPTCTACAKNHIDTLNLIKQNNNIHCQVILAANAMGNELADIVARKILNLPDDEMAQALDDWFASQNLKKWLSKLSDSDVNCPPRRLEISERWLSLARITKAPTIFMNHIEYPSAYTIKDAKKVFKILQTNGFANQV